MMITEYDLQYMRSCQLETFNETATIEHRVTEITRGGSREVVTTTESPCRRVSADARAYEGINGERLSSVALYKLTFPYDVDIDTSDTIIISGQKYDVNTVAHNSYKTALRVIATEVS